MSGVSLEKMLERGHEAGMCGTRSTMCCETKRKESSKRKGQTEQYHEWIAGNDKNGTRGK